MNVHTLLKERCNYNYREAPDENGWEEGREIPENIQKRNLPEDFTEYYQKYDGGCQGFYDHGWPTDRLSVSLGLFALEEMEERTQKLYAYADMQRTEYYEDLEFSPFEKAKQQRLLNDAFQNILVVGFVAASQSSPDLIFFCRGCFYVLAEDNFVNFSIEPTEEYLQSLKKYAVYDESFYGFLNKLLDVLLKNNQTIFALSKGNTRQKAVEINNGSLITVDAEKKDAIRRDAIRGSLLGGAIGDALGFPVEFMSEHSIFSRYGSGGIQALEKDPDSGKALISDDTQMTLFTANGILFGLTRGSERGIMGPLESYVAYAYQDWLYTQTMSFDTRRRECEEYVNCFSWLTYVPELYSRRAPGNTCMSALRTRKADAYSKGCGGVMRVAPMGLLNGEYPIEEADRIGASIAAITHGHPLGWLPAAVLVHILHRIVYSPNGETLREIVLDARDTVARLYADEEYLDILTAIINRAIELSENADSDLNNIHRLGEGWVGEEALAIAIYCALRHQDDFSAGIIAAVNHRGDSDSTGAVTGNILGAWCGFDAIEPKWKADLELRDVLLEMADDLAEPEKTPGWQRKYIDIQWKTQR